MGEWAAAVSAECAKRKDMALAVFREAVQRTIDYAQNPVGHGGNMPVRTGFLRASGQAVIGDALPTLVPNPNPHGAFSYAAGDVNLTIASATLDDTITFGWAANYARPVNYGSGSRKGYLFRDLAAQRWNATVDEVSREAEALTKNG